MTFDFDNASDSYIDLLFCFLARHEPFMVRLEQLRQTHSKLIKDYSWERIKALKSVEDPSPSLKSDCRLATEYHDDLVTLAMSYGLKPDWAVDRINYGIVYPKSLVIGPTDSPQIAGREYTITWNTWDFPIKKQIAENVMVQFKRQWSEFEQGLKQDGFERTRKRKKTLETPRDHMRWVFKRVCLRQSWNNIAEEEQCAADTIRKAVEPIADRLGLIQPRIKGGRPPKK